MCVLSSPLRRSAATAGDYADGGARGHSHVHLSVVVPRQRRSDGCAQCRGASSPFLVCLRRGFFIHGMGVPSDGGSSPRGLLFGVDELTFFARSSLLSYRDRRGVHTLHGAEERRYPGGGMDAVGGRKGEWRGGTRRRGAEQREEREAKRGKMERGNVTRRAPTHARSIRREPLSNRAIAPARTSVVAAAPVDLDWAAERHHRAAPLRDLRPCTCGGVKGQTRAATRIATGTAGDRRARASCECSEIAFRQGASTRSSIAVRRCFPVTQPIARVNA